MKIIDMNERDQNSQGEVSAEQRRERMQRALTSLQETLSDIAHTVEDKKGERCPYRNALDECTYRGGCQNKQRRGAGESPLCGGDNLLKW